MDSSKDLIRQRNDKSIYPDDTPRDSVTVAYSPHEAKVGKFKSSSRDAPSTKSRSDGASVKSIPLSGKSKSSYYKDKTGIKAGGSPSTAVHVVRKSPAPSNDLKHILWAVTIFLSIFLICATILKVVEHPYTIRFEIDNNTLEAVKSINWTAVNQKGNENRCFVNDIEIPCSNFTGDEHFCKDGICRMNGVCGGSYESNLECIKNLTRKT